MGAVNVWPAIVNVDPVDKSADPDTMDGPDKEIRVDDTNGVGPVDVGNVVPLCVHSDVDDGYRIVTRLLEHIPMSVESLIVL